MPDIAPLVIELLDELARVRGRTQAAFRDIRVAHGLSEVENVVLSAVTGARRHPTVPQIGRSLGHPRQVIQRAADALVARNLLAWRDNPDHKRARLLFATVDGATLHESADRAGLQRAERLGTAVDPEVLTATVAGLRTIRTAIEVSLRGICADHEDGEP